MSQQAESDQGGDGGDEAEEEDSVKTISDPNRPEKRKSREVQEMNKPQSRKKAKSSKYKGINEEPAVTLDEIDQALTKSTKELTSKWSDFADLHLTALTGVAKRILELKDITKQSVIGTAASRARVSM